MKRSDRRRIKKGLILCENKHWYKPFINGILRSCPICKKHAKEITQ